MVHKERHGNMFLLTYSYTYLTSSWCFMSLKLCEDWRILAVFDTLILFTFMPYPYRLLSSYVKQATQHTAHTHTRTHTDRSEYCFTQSFGVIWVVEPSPLSCAELSLSSLYNKCFYRCLQTFTRKTNPLVNFLLNTVTFFQQVIQKKCRYPQLDVLYFLFLVFFFFF